MDNRAVWDSHAAADPLWAVLSADDKKGRRWDLQEFMRSGEREVALLMRQIRHLGLAAPSAPVLDFGCGVGRLTQAFARRFERVTGADVSSVMIAIAERLNQYPGRARYVCTSDSGIETWPARAFGLIYSNIVLQHVAPEVASRYLEAFFHVAQPGGLIVFQVPSHRAPSGAAEIVPMPDDAYRGSVALAGPAPSAASPGAVIAVPIIVRNLSPRDWSQPDSGPMAAGNHWLDASGTRMVHQDDGRAPLTQRVSAGGTCDLLLEMRAPSEPGRYVAEIDLVQEGVTWFAHKGVQTLRFAVDVTGEPAADARVALEEYGIPMYPASALPPPPPGTGEPEPFAMHAIPQADVLALVRRSGGTVAHIEEDRRAGPDWVSYTYFATRGG